MISCPRQDQDFSNHLISCRSRVSMLYYNRLKTQLRRCYILGVFFSLFSNSAREFRNLRSTTTLSMLIAVALVLNLFASIQITDSLRLGFGFIATAIMGMLYGPVCAGVSAGIVDILQFFLKPSGEFFPGYTLTAILGGILYGIFLYKNKYSLPRIIAVKSIINIALHLILNSYWLTFLYGYAFWAKLPERIIKNIAMLPVEILILAILLPQIARIHKQRNR